MKQTFLDKHGPAICGMSALFMIGVMIMAFMLVAPDAIGLIDGYQQALVEVVEVVR